MIRLPGHSVRFCPVCRSEVHAHREPVADARGEVVVYRQHSDSVGRSCPMSGKRAAIRAVAFTGVIRRAS